MLEYKILDYKNIVYRNGESYIDLMSDSFISPPKDVAGKILMVNEYYVARPDLISLAVYGNDSYADIICKINGISNPFELAENTLLFLPEMEYMLEVCKSAQPSEFVGDESESPLKIKNYQKKKDEKRTPAEMVEGEKNYVIDKSLGMVFY